MKLREKYTCDNCAVEVPSDQAWVFWTEHQVDYWEGKARAIEPILKVVHNNDACWQKNSRDYPLRMPLDEFVKEFEGFRMQINAAAWDGLVLRASVLQAVARLFDDADGEEFFNITYNDYYRHLRGDD